MERLSRQITILATPTVQALEIAGPAEVFATANRKLREAGRSKSSSYIIEIISATTDLVVHGSSGMSILANRSFAAVVEPIDTLLVAGGMELWSARSSPELLDWLQKQAVATRRVASVCTGAFLLAEADLLNGKRATTHWYFCQQLQEQFPEILVDPEPIFIRDGKFSTSAGVTSGIDLALAMVEEDLGIDIALRVARALVLFLRRSEGQSQFSTSLAFQATSRLPLREIPIFILENLDRDLSLETLASRLNMSSRNFSRVFFREFSETPASFVERLRLETAQRLVKESDRGLEDIAESCGFGGVDVMRRAFQRRFGMTPSAMRE